MKLGSLKSKIIVSMVSLSLVTAIVIGGISILRSSQIISENAKEMLLISSNNRSSEIYSDLKQVEKNVNLMGDFAVSSSSIRSQSDMNKLRDHSSADAEYSRIRIYPEKLGENTKWCMSSYFYFDQNYVPAFDGAWYVGKDGNFKRKILNTPITHQDGGYYWVPVTTGKGTWAAPYVDADLKIPMITYAAPVYKNGFLLGLAGMDITLDNLNQIVKNIKIYKNTDAFIIDNSFNFIAGEKFKVGDNILTQKKGLYKFLEKSLKSGKSGYAEYKDGGISKIITYSTLPNGFILLIDVPMSEVLAAMNNMIFLLAFLAILAVILTIIIAVKIGEKISRPIENMAQISLKLADNDLTVSIDEDNSSKEMMHLSRSFKRFAEHLRDLIKQILGSAVSVSSSAEEMNSGSKQTLTVAQQIAHIADQLAKGSQEQAGEINACLSNINNMSSLIHRISANINDVVCLAKTSEDNAGNGYKLAEKAVSRIKLIKDTTIETSQVTSKLNNLASEIGMIVDLIKSIADQTNLLALNAAIEAARAGEHGKGFAVVADEVKKLAGQSAEATEKITDMIKEIQDEAGNASNAMTNSTNMVEEGVVIVESMGENLEKILDAAVKVSNNAEEVSRLINNAASNSDNVSKIMGNISAIIEESTANAEEMAGSTQEQEASLGEINSGSQSLAKTAEDLKSLVSVFRV